jgi:hypothetical protein
MSRSKLPPPKPHPPRALLIDAFNEELQRDFQLAPLGRYTLMVEGLTDVQYLKLAAELAEKTSGFKLLEITSAVDTGLPGAIPISVVTPLLPPDPANPGQELRGGIPHMKRFAEWLRFWRSRLDLVLDIIFIFDHDQAGKEDGLKYLQSLGYKPNVDMLTLNPEYHPNSLGKKDAVIEDLLSLEIQTTFFKNGQHSCAAKYVEGVIVRYDWDSPSKYLLPDYVAANASWADVREVGRIIARAKDIWGAPTPKELFQ